MKGNILVTSTLSAQLGKHLLLASLTSFSGLGLAPNQSAVLSDQHLSTCSPEGLCGSRLRGLWQVNDGTALLPQMVHVGLGPSKKELLGFLWGRQISPSVHTPVVWKPCTATSSFKLAVARPPLCSVIQSSPAHAAPW